MLDGFERLSIFTLACAVVHVKANNIHRLWMEKFLIKRQTGGLSR